MSENEVRQSPKNGKDSAEPKGIAATVVKALADNPIKTGSALALLLGFGFQVMFWASIGDMPQLNFEDLATVFTASAPIGLVLLFFIIIPFFVPGIAWVSIRSEMLTALIEAEKHLSVGAQKKASGDDGSEPEPQAEQAAEQTKKIGKPEDGEKEQAKPEDDPAKKAATRIWRTILSGAAAGGLITLGTTFIYAFFPKTIPEWLFLGVALSIAPAIVLIYLIWRYAKVTWTLGITLVLLGFMSGFGGSAIALPLATIAQLVSREVAASQPLMQFITLAGDSVLLLGCSFMLAWHPFRLREYLVLIGAVFLVSFFVVLVPLNVHVYVAQGVARTLGQGALPGTRLAVTEEECRVIQALSYPDACIERGGVYVTRPLTVLNSQGDSWFVEFHLRCLDMENKEGDDPQVYQLHVPREAIKGTIRVQPAAALVIDPKRTPDPAMAAQDGQCKTPEAQKPTTTPAALGSAR